MDPAEILKNSHSSNVVFHKFVLLHRLHKEDLFCFYEGRDSQYYFPRINSVEERHHTLVCGNKKAVQESYKTIKSKYPQFRTKFFIDSDFDENEELIDLYITPTYSIENFYCSENVISNILKNEFLFHTSDEEYNEIMKLFLKLQKQFHEGVKLFNLWYYIIKKESKKNGSTPNVSLGNKLPKEFIEISLENVTVNYDLRKIKEKFPNACIEVSEDDLKKHLNDFDSKIPYMKFRGKYEIEFITKFLMKLIEDANKHNKFIKKKTKFRFDPALILTQLSQYADTPKCLKLFVKNCA